MLVVVASLPGVAFRGRYGPVHLVVEALPPRASTNGTMAFATPSNITPTPPAAARAAGAPGAARGEAILAEQSRLLVHPASARVVLEILQSSTDVGGDLTRTILTDPALAAAVLRAANSAHLGYSRRIGGVRQASVMLGSSLVNSLAASRVADLVFDTDAPDYPDWLWLHSITTACAAAVLARRSGESADDAYTAGLLHEVGWLLAVSAESPTPDQDHAAIGGRLLAKWNLPDRIVAATTFHHTRPAALTGTLDRVVVAAHAFATSLGATSPERSLTTIEALQLVGLADARPSVITNEIEAELASVTSDLVEQR